MREWLNLTHNRTCGLSGVLSAPQKCIAFFAGVRLYSAWLISLSSPETSCLVRMLLHPEHHGPPLLTVDLKVYIVLFFIQTFLWPSCGPFGAIGVDNRKFSGDDGLFFFFTNLAVCLTTYTIWSAHPEPPEQNEWDCEAGARQKFVSFSHFSKWSTRDVASAPQLVFTLLSCLAVCLFA